MPTLLYSLSRTGERVPALEVDTLISSTSAAEAQPTTSPVEDGSDVTDHVNIKNRTYSVEAIVTDTPLGAPPQPGRWLIAWGRLGSLLDSATRLVLVLPVGEVQPVLLTQIQVVKDSTLVNGLRFTASFLTLNVATTQVVPALRRVEPKTKPNQQLGQQTPKPADEATAARARRKTLLLRALTAVGVTSE